MNLVRNPGTPDTLNNTEENQSGKTKEISGYEQFRDKRIKENMERMQKLGIMKLKSEVLPPNRSPKSPSERKTSIRSPLPCSRSGPSRRSSRLQSITPVIYSEEDRTLFVDGYGMDGNRICDLAKGNICPQCRKNQYMKDQQKKVECEVPAEGLSLDVWDWRKNGEKLIKGSPYTRCYYRCSSSEVCYARKQVERSFSDPTMFIIIYTGEHNHPASTRLED